MYNLLKSLFLKCVLIALASLHLVVASPDEPFWSLHHSDSHVGQCHFEDPISISGQSAKKDKNRQRTFSAYGDIFKEPPALIKPAPVISSNYLAHLLSVILRI